jgi:hypothetical protein
MMAWPEIEGAGNDGKTLGPIEAVPRKHAFFPGVGMKLDAVAVVFDFVNPLLALGSLALQGRKLGLNEPRHLQTLCHKRNSQKARR